MLRAFWRFLAIPSLITILLMQCMQGYFLLQNKTNIQKESLADVLQSFTNSFSIDLATWAYLFILPVLFFIITISFKIKGPVRAIYVVYYTLISVCIIDINWIDVQMFSYWNAKLSAKALSYLNTPQMMVASAGYSTAVFFTVMNVLLLVLFGILYYKILPYFEEIKRRWAYVIPFVVMLTVLVLAMRGGLREIPINQSDAYYSENQVLNVAGVNSIWNFGNVLFQNRNSLKSNPYEILPKETAASIFADITRTPQDSSTQVLRIKQPNIVLLTMEGVNANCISNYNSALDYMPELSKLMDQAYAFKNMYASGMRTDQGLVAVLSGFPAFPLHTIGAQPEKFQYLPSLSLDLKAQGYSNTFFFAGEPEFGSFKAFLVHNGFEKIYSLKDFPSEQRTQDLGAPDEFLFERFLADANQLQEPFFSLMLTQTTHEPFDMPFNQDVEDDAIKYINTVRYVDSLIGKWYEACKTMPWFDNTLFIISSDHSHTFPARYWYTDPQRFRIPFIMFGPALDSTYQGQMNTQIVNQTDIPLSLAKQMGLPTANYTFSKDMFNPYSPEYSSFIHIHGHTWLRPDEACIINYELDKQTLIEKTQEDSCILKNAAYFQVAFQTYMNY